MGTKGLEIHRQLLAAGSLESKTTVSVKNLDFIWQDDEQAAKAWLATKPDLEYGYPYRDQRNCFPLSAAIMEGSEKYVRLFLEAGADPNGVAHSGNQLGRTHLMKAAMAGRLDLVKVLVESGAGLRKRDRVMATARHLAANDECARYLRQEEKWEREGEKLYRILSQATYNSKTYRRDYDDEAIIKLIREHSQLLLAPTGSNYNKRQFYWEVLLSPPTKPEQIVHWVQSAGVDFNRIQSRTGELSLVQAVVDGSEWKVKILMKCGALPETKGRDGRNAFSALEEVKNEKVKMVLKELLNNQTPDKT